MKKKKPKFLRTQYWQYSKLGHRRKKKLKYRRATGIDNKIRLKMKGHLRNVSIGFKNENKTRGLIKGLKPVYINTLEELKKIKEGEIAIINGKIGKKKKIEMAKYALEKNIKIYNFDPKKFLEKFEKEKIKEKENQQKEKSKTKKKIENESKK